MTMYLMRTFWSVRLVLGLAAVATAMAPSACPNVGGYIQIGALMLYVVVCSRLSMLASRGSPNRPVAGLQQPNCSH